VPRGTSREAVGVVRAEQLAPGGFGRFRDEVRLAEQAVDHRVDGTPGRREAAVDVERERGVGAAREQVDQRHAGARVERAHARERVGARGARRRHHGDVADAAEVLEQAPAAVVAEEQRVGRRHERCALPAGRDVARAEVVHHRHAEPLGDHRRVAHLPRRVAGLVPDGLPV
jgi:hypothetical protein